MNVLTIAGSDPSSGAGIQSDIRTFSAFGCHGFTAITAITGQNTSKFSRIEAVSPKMLASQIDSVLSDFQIHAIKTGVLLNSSIIKTVYKKIAKLPVPIIVDPVIKSTTGGRLLEKSAIGDFGQYMIPISTVITPNIYELETLSGKKIKNKTDITLAVDKLITSGAKNVIVTGFDQGNKISDMVYLKNKRFTISGRKITLQNHGSGCNYSAALAASLANGNTISESIKTAKKFAYESIKNSQKLGLGLPITKNRLAKNEIILKNAIEEFAAENKIWKHIPQCQTNFVYSKPKPKTTKDILGLDGRIVQAGNKVIVAGEISHGGSKHVASAVLEMNKKFPSIRSGVNIKYDEKTIAKIKKKGLKVSYYNRRQEPKGNDSSVSWGIKTAIRNAKSPYDAIFHKGDFGKEPMIILFGTDPQDVMRKISLIL